MTVRDCSRYIFLLLLLAAAEPGVADGDIADPRARSLLAPHQGDVVLVDFWASWCPPCVRSFPWMNTMLDRYGDEGLTVVAVNVDRERAKADRFLERYPAAFELVFDAAGELAEAFDVAAMPSSYLIGRDGKLVSVHRGFTQEKAERLERAIAEILQSTRTERSP